MNVSLTVTPTETEPRGEGWAGFALVLKSCDDWVRQYYVAHFLWLKKKKRKKTLFSLMKSQPEAMNDLPVELVMETITVSL